ncbi:hypothetical protein [Pricia sp.]|uniref:hypothetical protein n=1 Tax=Pricia sp. TaxID=2268138 RepID=UPI0035941C44
MRQLFFTFLFTAATLGLNAQEATELVTQEVQVGDTFQIGSSPDAAGFKHIDFPRLNFIVKRGGIANYKSVEGNKVEVTSVDKKNGTVKVKIKRADGGRFFGSHTVVSADLNDALTSGELR